MDQLLALSLALAAVIALFLIVAGSTWLGWRKPRAAPDDYDTTGA